MSIGALSPRHSDGSASVAPTHICAGPRIPIGREMCLISTGRRSVWPTG